MGKSKGKYFLIGMILLSLALGIFISYFFVFVNALFISEIGTSKLPMAYLISGIGGLFITWAFNSSEKKWGFAKASTVFGLFFALVMFLIWYAYVQGLFLYYVVFFAYSWFWVSSNFTALVFWKLPSNIFNLEENKKYNGIISSGEGISAIISYLSVPALLTLDFFTRDKFLLISFIGILAFSGITYFLGRGIVVKAPVKNVADNQVSSGSQKSLVKERYFQLIFLSVLLSVGSFLRHTFLDAYEISSSLFRTLATVFLLH
jgi:AAA family ATP:ADP antiporter